MNDTLIIWSKEVKWNEVEWSRGLMGDCKRKVCYIDHEIEAKRSCEDETMVCKGFCEDAKGLDDI